MWDRKVSAYLARARECATRGWFGMAARFEKLATSRVRRLTRGGGVR